MDEITIEGKVYISSKQAAKITGYAKDYVGQLCREGRVEARHIGRNWYVLEDSIREHRFGQPEEKPIEAPRAPESTLNTVSTWQKPQYVAEAPVSVPSLAPKAPEAPQVPVSTPAIADMQSAWKEWFEEKKPVVALPDGSDDFKDEYLPLIVPEPALEEVEPEAPAQEAEEMVVISRIRPEPEEVAEEILEGEKVELHRSYTTTTSPRKEYDDEIVEVRQPLRVSAPAIKAPYQPVEEKASVNGTIRALLMVLALASALIALVGTGNADQLLSGTSLDFGAQKEVIDFLGGKSTYESSL